MPSEKQYLERKENIAAILQYLRLSGPKSRRQIADKLNLSWGCVSELVWILLSQNILLEEEAVHLRSKGRAPGVLRLNSDICFLGVDINRNGLNACLCDLSGQRNAFYSDTLLWDSKESWLRSVCGFVQNILEKHPNIHGIGFAMQGILDRNSGIWDFSVQPPIQIDFAKDLQSRFHIPTVVEHDPNCILYGYLDNTDARKMVLRLDQGIGAAVYSGSSFMADNLLEVSCLVVNEQGQRLRDVVSLNQVKALCGTSWDREHPSQEAIALFESIGKYLGITLGNLCNLLSLDEILLCGELSAYSDLFLPYLEQHYKATVLPSQKAKISYVPVTDAAYGAAKMAIDQFQY